MSRESTGRSRTRSRLRPGILALILLLFVASLTPALAEQPEKPIPPSEVEGRLQEILSRPEFASRHSPWGRMVARWLGRLQDRLGEGVEGLPGFFSWLWTNHPAVYILIVSWLLLTALFILGHMGFILYQSVRAGRAAAAGERAGPGRRARFLGEKPGKFIRRAEEAADEGRFLEAATTLYLGLLAYQSRAGAIVPGRGKTNWDYVQEFGRQYDADPMAGFSRVLDRCLYGGRQCDRNTYARCKSCFDRTLKTLELA